MKLRLLAALGSAVLLVSFAPVAQAQLPQFGFAPPAQLRTDSVKSTMQFSGWDDPGDGSKHRLRVTVSAATALTPSDVTVYAPDPATFTSPPMTWTALGDGSLQAVWGPTEGSAYFPTFNFQISAANTAPLGDLTLRTELLNVDGAGTIQSVDATDSDPVTLYADPPTLGSVWSVAPADQGARFCFKAVSSDGGRPVLGYVVRLHPSALPAGDTSQDVVHEDPGPAGCDPPLTVSGLVNNTSYDASLVAYNAVGDSVAKTTTVTPGPPPKAPDVTAVAPAYSGVRVDITPPAPGDPPVTAYQAFVGQDYLNEVLPPDPVHGRDYYLLPYPSGQPPVSNVVIKAYNDSGYSAPSVAFGPVRALQAPPENLTASGTGITAGGLKLSASWELPEWSGAYWQSKVCVVAGSQPATDSCTGTTLTNGYYRLRDYAVDSTGGTAYTVTVFFDTIDAESMDPDHRFSDPSWVTLDPAKVTVDDTSMSLDAGDGLTLTGSVGSPAGRARPRGSTASIGLGGQKVTLWARTTGAWSKAATVTTDDDGDFRARVHPTATTRYQWRFGGDDGVLGDLSPTIVAAVSPDVTATFTRARVRLGTSSTLWGTVSAGHAGSKIELQQLVSGSWRGTGVTARIAVQRLPNGTRALGYQVRVAAKAVGSRTYRARFVPDATGTASSSPGRRLTVTAG